MSKILIPFLLLFILSQSSVSAQYLVGFHTAWDDSVSEWELEIEIDSTTMIDGTLDLIWDIDGNTTEWNYRVDDIYGEVYQKFKGRDDQWEIRAGAETITIKQPILGDPSRWKISSGNVSFTMLIGPIEGRIIHPKEFLEDDSFSLYQEVIGDYRDWIVHDYLPEEYTFNMRMAAAFITIYTAVYSRQ